MLVRSMLGHVRRAALANLNQRRVVLDNPAPVVTFSFDDFPRSAYAIGGAILKSYGVRGTYYAAMGFLGTSNHQGDNFVQEDLDNLLADGHDLGSHTYSHISCRASPLDTFCADVIRGEKALHGWRDGTQPGNFAYPFGDVTFSAKEHVGSIMKSCRGITPGIMTSFADLNLLRANSLYSRTFDSRLIERMMAQNSASKGWLIFYTHDVRDNPSPFGCTPQQLEFVVRRAVKILGARVLTVSEAIESISGASHDEHNQHALLSGRGAVGGPTQVGTNE